MFVGEDLGLQEVELGLCEGSNSLCEGLIFSECFVFEDVIVEALKLVVVGDVVSQYFLSTLGREGMYLY